MTCHPESRSDERSPWDGSASKGIFGKKQLGMTGLMTIEFSHTQPNRVGGISALQDKDLLLVKSLDLQ